MKVVIDTNVLVSGLLSPYGNPGEIVRMISSGNLSLCFDARILSEYSDVLSDPKFPFHSAEIEALLEQIQHGGFVVAAEPLAVHLKDPDDEAFLEVAMAGKAKALVTGNLKHFPRNLKMVRVLSPSAFLNYWRRQRTDY